MKFVLVADLHLKLQDSLGVNSGGVNSRLLDKLASIKQSIDYAVSINADGYIIAGDVFEKVNPSEKLRRYFRNEVLIPLLRSGITVFYLMGNHDTNGDVVNLETESSIILEFSDKFYFIDKPAFMNFSEDADNTFGICFVPYGFEIPDNTDKAEILIGHHAVFGAEMGSGVISKSGEEVKKEDFRNFKYSFLGHYHKPQGISIGSSKIMYIGSTNVWDFGERLDKKRFLVLNTKEGKIDKIDSIPLLERPFIQYIFLEGESWEIKDAVIDAVIKLVFKGTKSWINSIDFQAIERSYLSLGAHKIITNTEKVDDDRRLEMRVEEGEQEEVIIKKYCDAKKVDKRLTKLGLDVFEQV